MQLSRGNKKLLDLTTMAHKGELMLPDFQRPFVWTRADIEELLESLLEGMFIGTFLINHTTPQNTMLKTIPIDGAELVNPNFQEKPYILILDGQQRLSSAFYALYEPDRPLINTSYPYRFFIKLDKLLERNDDKKSPIEEVVISRSTERREFKEITEKQTIDGQNKYEYKIDQLIEKKLIPVSFLKEDFSRIRFTNQQRGYSQEDSNTITKLLDQITNYQVMTIDIPANESISNIAKLFEKTNRTGIKLSIFDLLTAKLYKFINVRAEREKIFDKNFYSRQFVNNRRRNTKLAYYTIQAIALHSGFKRINASEILNISDQELNLENRNQATEILENKVLKMLFAVDEFGIGNNNWFVYSHMVILYLAMFLDNHIDIDKIKMRHWASIFGERYGGATESKIAKDYKELKLRIDNEDKIPVSISEARNLLEGENSVFSLKDKSYAGSAVYKGVINLLFMNKCKDFFEKNIINFNADNLDDHHIFPKNFLEKKLGNKKTSGINYDTILNKTLIYSSTNRKISNKAPASYIQEMINIFGDEKKVIEIFEQHYIDRQMLNILKEVKEDSSAEFVQERFELFTSQREKLIKEKIKALIGIYNEVSLIEDFEGFLHQAKENKSIELKSSLRRDVDRGVNGGDYMEYNVLKTIGAFFNSQGGQIVIGAEDDKQIYGLDADYKTLGNDGNSDKFVLHLDNLIQKYFGNAYQGLIDIDIFTSQGKEVAVIFVKKSNTPVYMQNKGEKEFYIRRGASSVKLNIEEAQKYIQQNFS